MPTNPARNNAPPTANHPIDAIAATSFDAIIADFTARWKRGEPVCAEDYLVHLPPDAVAELIYQEYCLSEADHLDPDPADYYRRFPDQSHALSRLFSLHAALSVATLHQLVDPAHLPTVGDDIGPYRLIRQLGQGAFARVFLAEQADLGDRLVVVKVATRPSAEPTLLARARHANIVEVLRHTEADDGALHLVCLPFLGGATLGAVLGLRRLRARAGRLRFPRSGRHFLDDLDRASAPEYPATGLPRPAREVISRLSYPQALAWMIARLAEALDHAERRGVTHGDIKPSNILITADGTPMLFDFNLAVDWHASDDATHGADLGGTLAYMAPERLRALGDPSDLTVSGSRSIWGDVSTSTSGPSGRRQPDRHRADLYGLGLVLVEALTGDPPALPERRSDDPRQFASGLARLRAEAVSQSSHRSRGIPAALRAILARCLAPEPSDRYARGAELAEDLDRWRSDRPLVYAVESTRSRWGRRLRSLRFPIIAVALTMTIAAIVGSVAWSVLQGSQREQALSKLSYILDYTEGIFQTRKVGNWRSDSTEDPAELANRLLAHYDVVKNPDWRERLDVRALPPRERGELEAWLLEQTLRRAVAYGGRPNSPADYQRGFALLTREVARTPCTALIQQQAVLRDRIGLPATTGADRDGSGLDSRALAPWLEAYLLGVQAEPLHAREALGHYLDALKARPDMLWGHYRVAVVACRIGEYPLAIQSLRECVARRPKNEMLRNLLASTMYSLGRYAAPGASLVDLGEAQAECDKALSLNPDFAPATRTRTMINQLLGQTDGVRNDFDRFSMLTRSEKSTASLLLQISTRTLPGETFRPYSPDEEASLWRAVAADNHNDLIRADLADGLSIAGRSAETIGLYAATISHDSTHLNARFQRAVELARTGRAEGYGELAALVDHPQFEEIYRLRPGAFRAFNYLACDLLEKGRVPAAEAMIQRGWNAIRTSNTLRGEKVISRSLDSSPIYVRGEMAYNSARVAIVAAETEPKRFQVALDYLRDAFAESPVFRNEWFPKDRFFEARRVEILNQIDN